MTPDVMITNCSIPVGRMPPLSAMTDIPVLCPSTVNRPARKTMPTTRKVISATTLISNLCDEVSSALW